VLSFPEDGSFVAQQGNFSSMLQLEYRSRR